LTITSQSTPACWRIAAFRRLAWLAALPPWASNTALPLLSSVRTPLKPSAAIRARRSAMAMRLDVPTLMPRSSAMWRVMRAFSTAGR
jgi:hypothetical protein